MAGLIWRVFLWHILPLGTRPQHPQDAFKDAAVVLTGTAAGLLTLDGSDERRDDAPLIVGEMHGMSVSAPAPAF